MCLFKKPELRNDVFFDIHTFNKYGKETMNPDKFIASLTRKQIKMLNAFSADAHRSDQLEGEIEEDMHREYVKAVGEIRQEELEKMMSDTFTEAERIHDDQDYANYLNNNRDMALLSEDEEKKLMDMLSGFAKKKNEINARLDEMEKDGAISKSQAKMAKKMTDFITKSAKELNK